MARSRDEYTPQVSLTRGDSSAINLPMPGPSIAENITGLTADLSAAIFEVDKQRSTARMVKGISDIQIETTRRMQDFALNGTGGRPLAEVAVEDFAKTANDFIASQPAYLRDTAREKMLGLKNTVAGQALATQAALEAEELKREVRDFSNNLTNEVRFGTLDEGSALSSISEYAANLPENVREAVEIEMRDSVRLSSLNKMVNTSPGAVISALKSGAYNDMDPAKLDSLYRSAVGEIRAAETKRETAFNKSLELRGNDNYEAGSKYLSSQGIDNPTLEQNLQAQRQLGINPGQLSIISKDQAKFEVSRLQTAQTKDEFYSLLNLMKSEYVSNPADEKVLVENLQRMGDMPGTMKLLLGVDPADPNNQEFTDSAWQVIKNPEIVASARSRLYAGHKVGNADIADFSNDVSAEHINMLAMSGTAQDDIMAISQAYGGVATVMAANRLERGVSNSWADAKKKVRADIQNMGEDEIRGSYSVPKQHAVAASDRHFNQLKSDILKADDVIVDVARFNPEGISEMSQNRALREEYKKSILRTSYWANNGPDKFVLMSAQGQPLKRAVIQDGRYRTESVIVDIADVISTFPDVSQAFPQPSKPTGYKPKSGIEMLRDMRNKDKNDD